MQNLYFLIFFLFLFGCQKNSSPDEIVRIVPGKSLMEQVAPSIKRKKKKKSKIYLVPESATADQIDLQIKNSSIPSDSHTYPLLYISGQKAKDKKKLKEKMDKTIAIKKAGK